MSRMERFDWKRSRSRRRSPSRSVSSSEGSRHRSYKNSEESYYEEKFYDDSIYDNEVVKYECKLCLIKTTCQKSLDNHMRGKGHLKRELLVQEEKKENNGVELKTSNWGKASRNNYERWEYLELKKNMTSLQTMYQEKVRELNKYKTMYDEQQSQLKEMKDKLRWCEEKHNEKEEFKMRNTFVFKKEVKSEDIKYYLDLETQSKKNVKSEYIEYEGLGTVDSMAMELKENMKKKVKNEDIKVEEFGTVDRMAMEELKEVKSEDIEYAELGTDDMLREESKEKVKMEMNSGYSEIVELETRRRVEELREEMKRCEDVHCIQID